MTRRDYMEGKCTHREYYSQFVTVEILRIIAFYIGVEAIDKSTDESFNDIPLSKWDSLGQCISSAERYGMFKKYGDSMSMAGLVCVFKTGARILKEKDSDVYRDWEWLNVK